MCYTIFNSYKTETKQRWRCFTTRSHQMNKLRQLLLTGLVLCLLFLTAPHFFADDDYNTTLDRLGRLQALANTYVKDQDPDADPIVLTLAYTRVGEYNTQMWQLTAGVRDAAFESYVNSSDSDLQALQDVTTVELPGGQKIDFGHLLASMNLVYNGIPITGSWGGDCMQLAKAYYGQASDEAGYANAMRATFNIDDDGTNSVFGDQDLRADIDSVNVGATLTKDSDIAKALKDYYENLSANVVDYARAKQFIMLSFGTVDTSSDSFKDEVYNAMMEDSGMQLLLYMNGMWTTQGWTVKEDYAPALHGATDLLAEWLSTSVNGEKIKSDTNDRLVAMGGQALSEALAALGDSDAASEALNAAQNALDGAGSTASTADSMISGATETLQEKFNIKIFQLILLIVAAAAILMMIVSIALFASHHSKRKKAFEKEQREKARARRAARRQVQNAQNGQNSQRRSSQNRPRRAEDEDQSVRPARRREDAQDYDQQPARRPRRHE